MELPFGVIKHGSEISKEMRNCSWENDRTTGGIWNDYTTIMKQSSFMVVKRLRHDFEMMVDGGISLQILSYYGCIIIQIWWG